MMSGQDYITKRKNTALDKAISTNISTYGLGEIILLYQIIKIIRDVYV